MPFTNKTRNKSKEGSKSPSNRHFNRNQWREGSKSDWKPVNLYERPWTLWANIMLNSQTDTLGRQLLAPGTPVHLSPGLRCVTVFLHHLRARTWLCTLAQVHLPLNETQRCCQVFCEDFRTPWSWLDYSLPSTLSVPLFLQKTLLSPLLFFSLSSPNPALRFCASLICLISIFYPTVSFGFLVGHLESQRRNYFSAFCWDGGMSLLWNAAWLANGVTQDGWSEATGMRGIDEQEKW